MNSQPLFPSRSAQKPQQQLAAGVVSIAAAALSSPLAAQAAATPSLNNFVGSLVAGGVVLVGLLGAITAVSGFDPVKRD